MNEQLELLNRKAVIIMQMQQFFLQRKAPHIKARFNYLFFFPSLHKKKRQRNQ